MASPSCDLPLPMKLVPDAAAWFRAMYLEAPAGTRPSRVLKSKVRADYCAAYGAAALPYRILAHELTLAGFKMSNTTVNYIKF